MIAAVVVDLRAAAAGARLAHRPEVLRRAQLGDARRRHQPLPDGVRLVVARNAVLAPEDRRVQALGGQAPHVRQKLPRERDGVGLEVVAEREVAEHLEEGVMPEGGPDVLQVVVLAADPHAFLRGGGAPILAALGAQENILELVHSRVGEQQGRVVPGDEGGAGHDAVPALAEIIEEALSNLGRSHPDHFDTRRSCAGAAAAMRSTRDAPPLACNGTLPRAVQEGSSSSGPADAPARSRSVAVTIPGSKPRRTR